MSDEVPLQLGRLGIIAAGYDTERQMQVQIVKVRPVFLLLLLLDLQWS